MAAIDPDVLLRARDYLTIKHHVPGRIRLRFDPGILEAVPELNDPKQREAMQDWEAIQDIQVKPLSFSLVIIYDSDKLAPDSWENLLTGSEEEARAVIERLRARTG